MLAGLLAGTVQLSMSGLLKFLPILYAAMDNAIQIDIKPWKFNWGYDKLKIRFSGAMTDTLDWYFSEDNVNRSFECYLTIKKRKFFLLMLILSHVSLTLPRHSIFQII
ncbi:MAG: hypothetical protein WCC17_19265 [Candidatus Nitrosopolaris sp.]